MNRKHFLKTAVGLLAVPFIGISKSEAKTPEQPKYDRLKLSHQYPGSYHEPNDLFTPEEITEAGFVFVGFPTFIHKFDDPQHPLVGHSWVGYGNHINPTQPNYRPMIAKTSRYCGIRYIKTYDIDKGRWRGMESVGDYYRKKDIFKPMILEWMKKMEYHYVHRVLLEDSPYIWQEITEGSVIPSYYHMHALNVRGCRLPKKI